MSKEARHLKRIDAPLPRGPVQPVRGLGFLRRDPEILRRDPVRRVRGPEILRHAAEFLPLDPERQRKERRYAL